MPRSTNQRPGTAGRYNGKGEVYVMCMDAIYHKIGCSRKPYKRLKQIREKEKDNDIKLIYQIRATKMRDAEASAQKAAKRLRFRKDRSRGHATDWFEAPANYSKKKLKRAIREAVKRHNLKN